MVIKLNTALGSTHEITDALKKAFGEISTELGGTDGVVKIIKTEFEGLLKIVQGIATAIKFIKDPWGATKEGFQEQLSKAHPTLQRMFGQTPSEESEKRWADEKAKGNFTVWDNPFSTPTPEALKNNGLEPVPGGAPRPTPTPPEGGMTGMYRYSPMSYRGPANDNSSLLHRASFGGGDTFGGGSAEGRLQAIIKGGVYEALIEFYGFLQGGAKGGGGGVQNASFTTGNVPGAASSGLRSADGFSVLEQSVGGGSGRRR